MHGVVAGSAFRAVARGRRTITDDGMTSLPRDGPIGRRLVNYNAYLTPDDLRCKMRIVTNKPGRCLVSGDDRRGAGPWRAPPHRRTPFGRRVRGNGRGMRREIARQTEQRPPPAPRSVAGGSDASGLLIKSRCVGGGGRPSRDRCRPRRARGERPPSDRRTPHAVDGAPFRVLRAQRPPRLFEAHQTRPAMTGGRRAIAAASRPRRTLMTHTLTRAGVPRRSYTQ
ncbi:hypothetical protein EVAR_67061_1 [Eumeta japonica]|uniref:Uncharacterized protein n=1 Tax=Eumeta variegata TaxID=151549 RepID=A0A4C1ZHB1_EUMVA|nr:hypothetical protein EVAR_67061_1 [Eumeta japonica]